MIITDTFIMLNLPKTGSTFARDVIKKAYGESNPNIFKRLSWLLGAKNKKVIDYQAKNIKVANRNNKDQHGTFDQIPDQYKNSDREIVSIMRDPFAAYISRYNFGSWKKHASNKRMKFAKMKFPHFPKLSFFEYVEFVNIEQSNRLQGIKMNCKEKIGNLSLQFLQMFTRNHRDLIGKIHTDFMNDDSLTHHFPEITFLKNENLNDELFHFLKKHGFSAKEIDFIHKETKKNISTTASYENYLSKEIVSKIIEWEWILFELFPEYKPDNNYLINKT